MGFDLSDIPAPVIQLAVDGVRELAEFLFGRLSPDKDDDAIDRIAKATLKAAAEAAVLEAQNRAAELRIPGDLERMLVAVKAVEEAFVVKNDGSVPFNVLGPYLEIVKPE